MNGYHRKQDGSIRSDLFEIGCAFGVAILIGWAILSTMNGAGL